ncbi:MAG: DASH complex subunit dam1 [Icmadophila ericetorum]|nr:DASH complex subunit dam1 [Icmadophila ericetorum]
MDSVSASKRSNSRSRPLSRPTTPLRPSSRTSFRDPTGPSYISPTAFPLDALESTFANFSDSMADLEANFMHLQLMHESLSRFNENFAAFLYGLNMNAYCVDFPEAPIAESFKKLKDGQFAVGLGLGPTTPGRSDIGGLGGGLGGMDAGETTFMTTDTSFVENPSSVRPPSRYNTPASRYTTPASSRQSSGLARGRGGAGGIPRPASGLGRGGLTAGGRGRAGRSGLPRGRGLR